MTAPDPLDSPFTDHDETSTIMARQTSSPESARGSTQRAARRPPQHHKKQSQLANVVVEAENLGRSPDPDSVLETAIADQIDSHEPRDIKQWLQSVALEPKLLSNLTLAMYTFKRVDKEKQEELRGALPVLGTLLRESEAKARHRLQPVCRNLNNIWGSHLYGIPSDLWPQDGFGLNRLTAYLKLCTTAESSPFGLCAIWEEPHAILRKTLSQGSQKYPGLTKTRIGNAYANLIAMINAHQLEQESPHSPDEELMSSRSNSPDSVEEGRRDHGADVDHDDNTASYMQPSPSPKSKDQPGASVAHGIDDGEINVAFDLEEEERDATIDVSLLSAEEEGFQLQPSDPAPTRRTRGGETRLEPNRWINDKIIATIIMPLQSSRVKIIDPSVAAIKHTARGIELPLLLPRIPTDAERVLFFLCHARTHWTLVCVEPQTRIAFFYDSLRSASSNTFEEAQMYVTAVCRDNQSLSGLSFREANCPQQSNYADCGVFAMEVASRLARGKSIPSEFDGTELRRKFLDLHRRLTAKPGDVSPLQLPRFLAAVEPTASHSRMENTPGRRISSQMDSFSPDAAIAGLQSRQTSSPPKALTPSTRKLSSLLADAIESPGSNQPAFSNNRQPLRPFDDNTPRVPSFASKAGISLFDDQESQQQIQGSNSEIDPPVLPRRPSPFLGEQICRDAKGAANPQDLAEDDDMQSLLQELERKVAGSTEELELERQKEQKILEEVANMEKSIRDTESILKSLKRTCNYVREEHMAQSSKRQKIEGRNAELTAGARKLRRELDLAEQKKREIQQGLRSLLR